MSGFVPCGGSGKKLFLFIYKYQNFWIKGKGYTERDHFDIIYY